jgi:hypothetical protein
MILFRLGAVERLCLGWNRKEKKFKIGWMHAMQNGMEIMLSFSICLLARLSSIYFQEGIIKFTCMQLCRAGKSMRWQLAKRSRAVFCATGVM